MTTFATTSGIRRLLCVRLDNMGDILMTTPALRALRSRFPTATLTMLTSTGGSKITPYIPEIDETLIYDAPWVRTYGEKPSPGEVIEMAGTLRYGRFDAAVIFTVYTQSALPAALLCYLAGIPLRLAHNHENPYELLTDWVPDPEPTRLIRHEVDRQLELVGRIGAKAPGRRLSLDIPEPAVTAARKKLVAAGVSLKRRWLLMHPGCTEDRRRYPREGFIEAARELAGRHQTQIVLTGSCEEAALAEEVAVRIGEGAWSLAGKTTIEEFAALIALAPVLVTNNTLGVHIASALGTPVVDVYALTNPQHTPWMVPSRVLYFDVPCRDCERGICGRKSHPPRRQVQPSEIVEATVGLMRSGERPEPSRRVPMASGTRETTPARRQ